MLKVYEFNLFAVCGAGELMFEASSLLEILTNPKVNWYKNIIDGFIGFFRNRSCETGLNYIGFQYLDEKGELVNQFILHIGFFEPTEEEIKSFHYLPDVINIGE
jgi:hypothetical protein